MFLEYLHEKETEVSEKIYEKEKERREIDIKIKENRKFLEMIDEGKSTPFTEFTPQVITATEKKKQQNLSEKSEELLAQKKTLDDEITLLQVELENISTAISDAKKKFSDIKKAHTLEKKDIARRINSIIERNVSDPMRSNIELKEILKILEENQ